MQQRSHLSRAIMRRVYLMYLLRLVGSRLGLSVVVATGAAAAAAQLVSVTAILNNARTVEDIHAFISFVFFAFVGTNGMVQFLTFICGVAIMIMAREVLRAFNRSLPLPFVGVTR